jgi:predicted RNA binding protein YcfA (HicA-like mRNA interferase family)
VFQHPDDAKRRTIVSDHRGQDIPRGTLRAIIEQAGLTVDEFIDLL